MKVLILHRLLRYIVTYHFLSCFVIFLTVEVNGVLGKTDLKTKLLLQNIRSHLPQKVDDIVPQEECQPGLTICKGLKKKDHDEEKTEEILPPLKTERKYHKPFFKFKPKDSNKIVTPKAHSILEYNQNEEATKKPKKIFQKQNKIESGEESEESKEKIIKFKKKQTVTSDKSARQPPITSHENKEKSIKKQLSKISKVEVISNTKQEDNAIKKETKTVENDKKRVIKTDSGAKDKKSNINIINMRTKKIESEKKTKDEYKKKNDLTFPPGLEKSSFVFFLYSSEIQTDLCKKHSQVYLKQLKKYKTWALMMYDASAKLPSGILQGNINQLGDFDECLSINAVFKSNKTKSKEPSGIKGKYCLANFDVSATSKTGGVDQALMRSESFAFIRSTILDPGHFIPRFSSINWGLCVPSTCPAEDIEKLLASQLKAFNDTLLFNVSVEEENCVVKSNLKFEFNKITSVVIMFYLFVIGIAVYGTYIDSKIGKSEEKSLQDDEIEKEIEDASRDFNPEEERADMESLQKNGLEFSLKDKIREVVTAFSLKRNVEILLNDNNSDCIQCINGIKSVFTIMLYLAHKTIPLGMTPFSNRVLLTKISNEPTTVLLRTSIIYTDSFLLISGVLISYRLSKEISEKGKISWVKKSIARFIRLTPALFAITLFYAYIWDQLGTGPLWNLVVKKNSELCQQYMWRNLLYIQNFFAFENMCAPQTHQLALDMQLSLLAPLFVYLLYKYDKAGIGILQSLFLISSIMRYTTTFSNNLSVVIYHGMPVSQLYKTANLMYTQTLHRASPYILGTILGYYLRKYEKQFDVPKAFVALGWIIAFALGLYSVVSPSHLALRSYQYNVEEAAQYAALSPVAWSLALSWVICACHLGFGGRLNEFLCQKSLLVFSRISYSIYLTQFLVFFYKIGVKRIPEMFTLTGSFNITEFFIVIVISVIATLLFDIPMMEIKRIILDKKSGPTTDPEDTLTSEDQYTEESEENSEIKGSTLPEDWQEISYSEEEMTEERDEITDIKEIEEDDVDEDDDKEIEYEDESETMQPLRRSNRMQFDDESEDKEWFKVEEDTKENTE